MGGEPDEKGSRAKLCLSLLGGVDLTLDGVPLRSFVTLKSQALLCYLAMSDRPHSREALATLLWGESPEEQARASLRQALSNVQKLVGPSLHVARQVIEFDHDYPHWLDVDAFLAAARQGLSDALGARRQLTIAADLYRGDFLAGFQVREAPEFEEWVTVQRERLRQMAYRVLERLAQHHAARGAYEPASAYLGRLLELDPWREDAHRQRMVVLAYSGQHDAALSQYVALRRMLQAELGEEPAAETTELYRRIRSGALGQPPPPPPHHNLPVQPTPLLGRQAELEEVAALLTDSGPRLINLTGTGGIGKTRLALGVAAQVADDFAGGVYFVSLASIQDPDLTPQAIARALRVEMNPDQAAMERLKDWLQARQVLLVLDNVEHLLPAAAPIAELLSTCPQLTVLATSRAALRVRGERLVPVPPLALPDPGLAATLDDVQHAPAVALFLQRAQAIRPGFALTPANAPVVARICCRLDGLPLAIELAAARMRLLGPEALLARLERRLALLTDGAADLPPRQRTLRATIDWSQALLKGPEQELFRRLAVFVGGATLEAVDAVCGPLEVSRANGDEGTEVLRALGTLSDQSLVLRQEEADGAVRVVMLETIREYAAEQLTASGEGEEMARRHAGYYNDLAQRASLELTGPEQMRWLDRLEADRDNLRAALAWSLSHEPALALCLAGALWRFWQLRGSLSEGRRLLDEALAWHGGDPWRRARALNGAGSLALLQGDYEGAIVRFEEAMPLWRALRDKHHVAGTLQNLGLVRLEWGQYGQALPLLGEALDRFRELDDRSGMAIALANLGVVAGAEGKCARARELLEESLALYRQRGDETGIAQVLVYLGQTATRQGDLEVGAAHQKESLVRFRELGNQQGIAEALEGLAEIAARQGDTQRAVPLWAAAQGLRDRLGMPRSVVEQARYEQETAAVRSRIGAEAFDEAWADGAGTPEDAVIDEALGR